MTHDIIVIGASAGGTEVLCDLAGELPADLPASVFVVVHSSPDYLSNLPGLLERRGPLRSSHPVHLETIEPGHIYVAPPDNHLLLRTGRMEVVRGPRENGHRPAVDPLFRSASWSYGPRVVGVVLTGYQDCGTAGLMSIKARGGIAVVQEPGTARAAEMPRSAIERVDVDYVVDPIELPGLLARLATEPITTAAPAEPPEIIRRLEGDAPGDRAEAVCPLCHGVLTETHAGGFHQFRCHVGHTFTLDGLTSEQNLEVERALWAAVRSLEESSALSSRLAGSSAGGGLHSRFAEQGSTLMRHADLIRHLLLEGKFVLPPPATG